MDFRFPQSTGELLSQGREFRAELLKIKERRTVPDYGWYPYDSLATLEILARLLEPVFREVSECLASGPIADIGCADGDLGLFWARFGAPVDLVDHLESNFNQLRGVALLRDELGLPADVQDIDLDSVFRLPRPSYSFAFFLGTLYHLKNPYYALESLAAHCDWCFLSTRIARRTPSQTVIENEPVAYLLGAREANNDPTNYWVFSAAGLLRVLDRSGWTEFGYERVGQTSNSDPVHPDADERIFLLLKSKPRHPELIVRPVYGWYETEQNAWRWTAKKFGLDVVAPPGQPPSEFALRVAVPAAVFLPNQPVRLICTIDGELAGALTCTKPETIEFRGQFPKSQSRSTIRLDFQVESNYAPVDGDVRDLGIIVPLAEESRSNRHRIPFRVS